MGGARKGRPMGGMKPNVTIRVKQLTINQTRPTMSSKSAPLFEITLNAMHRIVIVARLLPQQAGSFKEARAVAALVKMLSLSDDEGEKIGLNQGQTGIQIEKIEEAVNLQIDYKLTPNHVHVIVEGFITLEESGKVPIDSTMMELYDAFEEAIELAKEEG